MMKRLVVRYCACLCLLGAALSLLSWPASAQQPTQAAQLATHAQIDAIRQACPGDYQTFCGPSATGTSGAQLPEAEHAEGDGRVPPGARRVEWWRGHPDGPASRATLIG
jgi:hypothetical protein